MFLQFIIGFATRIKGVAKGTAKSLEDLLAAIGGILIGVTIGMLGVAIIEAIVGIECPNCNYRVKRGMNRCPNCEIGLDWR